MPVRPCKRCTSLERKPNGECRPCARAYSRARYQRDPARAYAVSRRWKEENEEHVRAHRRAYKRALYGADPAKYLWDRARERASKKGLEFTITIDDVRAAWPPDNHCRYFPELGELKRGEGQQTPASPSLDRIDCTRGYVPDNIQVISWRANYVKGVATPWELRRMADVQEWEGI